MEGITRGEGTSRETRVADANAILEEVEINELLLESGMFDMDLRNMF